MPNSKDAFNNYSYLVGLFDSIIDKNFTSKMSITFNEENNYFIHYTALSMDDAFISPVKRFLNSRLKIYFNTSERDSVINEITFSAKFYFNRNFYTSESFGVDYHEIKMVFDFNKDKYKMTLDDSVCKECSDYQRLDKNHILSLFTQFNNHVIKVMNII